MGGHATSDPTRRLGYWRTRLYRNTYTYAGGTVRVKHWSVKIQHQARRRTFSFRGRRKTDAAREALAIYQAVLRRGWEAAETAAASSRAPGASVFAPPAAGEFPKTDPRFWRARLIARPYPRPAQRSPASSLSVLVNHQGSEAWFALGSNVPGVAAARALKIYRMVVKQGWAASCARHPREITLAIHWAANPLAWTYSTIHTCVSDKDKTPASGNRLRPSRAALCVAVVEPEECLRRALARWIDCQERTLCVVAYADPLRALRDSIPPRNTLWLVNRILPAMSGVEFLQRLARIVPDGFGLIYSVYSDSEHLFGSSPGGGTAYFFKRTPPDRLLAPLIAAGRGQEMPSPEQIPPRVRQYFQEAISSIGAEGTMRHPGDLTHREDEILQSLAKGYLDKEIAAKLGISTWTVHGHVKKIFAKLRVHTRTEAAVKYLQK